MESLKKNSKTIMVLVLLACVFYFYKTYFSSEVILEQDIEVEQIGSEVLSLNSKLQSVSLDQGLFSYPLYNQLVDFSRPIPNMEFGRTNPFAEVGQN